MNKKNQRNVRWLGAGLVLCLMSLAVAAGDKTSGPGASLLAEACTGCHGTDGASAGPAIPVIAGLSELYFFDTMQAFRDGSAPSTVMGHITKGYSEAELRLLASYFGAKPFVAAAQQADPALVKKGARLHDQYCEKCHAQGGSSRDEDAGVLAGQWQPYLAWTLADFRDGKRPMSKKMGDRLEKLLVREGDDGLTALLNFYASRK